MEKPCTVDTVDDEISYTADLESKSGGGEHTDFDHGHDLTSGIGAYTGHDLVSGGEPFDSLKSSIKILNQDQNQIIIKMKYDHCGPDKDSHFGPDKDGHFGPGKDGHFGPGKDGHFGPGKDGHFGPDKDGHCGLDKDGYGPDKDGHFEPDKGGFYMPGK